MGTMGRLDFGRLSDAWEGEAPDVTPLLADQLDLVGEAIQVVRVLAGRADARLRLVPVVRALVEAGAACRTRFAGAREPSICLRRRRRCRS